MFLLMLKRFINKVKKRNLLIEPAHPSEQIIHKKNNLKIIYQILFEKVNIQEVNLLFQVKPLIFLLYPLMSQELGDAESHHFGPIVSGSI
jgi:hypothetical protein